MHSPTHPLPARRAPEWSALGAIVAPLASLVRALVACFTATARLRAHRRALNQLNDATLRDIGLHRSEIDSYWAESEGLAETTRLRLMPRPRR